MNIHPDVLAAHAQFGGDLETMQKAYEYTDLVATCERLRAALVEERKRALESAAAFHDRKAGNFDALCAVAPSERAYEMARQHRRDAAAIRSLMEKPE